MRNLFGQIVTDFYFTMSTFPSGTRPSFVSHCTDPALTVAGMVDGSAAMAALMVEGMADGLALIAALMVEAMADGWAVMD